jgi:hypothetical protein
MANSNGQNLNPLPEGLETGVLYHISPAMEEGNPEKLCASTSSTQIDSDYEIHLNQWGALGKSTYQTFVLSETDSDGILSYSLTNVFTALPVSCEVDANIACAGGADAGSWPLSFELDSDETSILISTNGLYLTAPENFQSGGQLSFSAEKENKTGQKWKFQKPTIGFVDTDGFKDFK